MSVEIWHNPRCSKSRQTLALLEERDIDFTIVLYLQSPPSRAQLERAHRLLDQPVRDYYVFRALLRQFQRLCTLQILLLTRQPPQQMAATQWMVLTLLPSH